MTEDMVVETGAGGPGTREQRGARLRWSIVPIGLLGAAAVAMLLHHRVEQRAEAAAPFAVEGTRVDIRAGAPTWTYLEFAQAGLEDAVSYAPASPHERPPARSSRERTSTETTTAGAVPATASPSPSQTAAKIRERFMSRGYRSGSVG